MTVPLRFMRLTLLKRCKTRYLSHVSVTEGRANRNYEEGAYLVQPSDVERLSEVSVTSQSRLQQRKLAHVKSKSTDSVTDLQMLKQTPELHSHDSDLLHSLILQQQCSPRPGCQLLTAGCQSEQASPYTAPHLDCSLETAVNQSLEQEILQRLCAQSASSTTAGRGPSSRHEHIISCSSAPEGDGTNKGKPDKQKATSDQLNAVKTILEEKLPSVLSTRPMLLMGPFMDLHRKDVVFENFYKAEPKTIVGVQPYVTELVKQQIKSRIRYSYLKMKVVNSSIDVDESLVRIHWRIQTLGQLAIFRFWKITNLEASMTWHDGISTFHVDSDQKIYKHRVVRVTPIQEQAKAKYNPLKLKVAAGSV